jgi:hypothetical protein
MSAEVRPRPLVLASTLASLEEAQCEVAQLAQVTEKAEGAGLQASSQKLWSPVCWLQGGPPLTD